MAYHHSHPLEDLNGKKEITYQKKINKPKRFLVLNYTVQIYFAQFVSKHSNFMHAMDNLCKLQLWQVTSSS